MYYEDEHISDIPKPKDVSPIAGFASALKGATVSDAVGYSVRKPPPKDMGEAQGKNPPIDYTSKFSSALDYLQNKQADANIYDEDPISAVPPQAQPYKRIFSTSGETPDMTFETTKTAFERGFYKSSGVKTEIAGTFINPIGLAASAGGGLIGALSRPYSKEEQRKADKGTWSNMLVPGLAGYRLTRRIKSEHKDLKHLESNEVKTASHKTAFEVGFEKAAISKSELGLIAGGLGAAGVAAGFGAFQGHAADVGLKMDAARRGIEDKRETYIQRHPKLTGAASLGYAPLFSAMSTVRERDLKDPKVREVYKKHPLMTGGAK